MRKTADPKCEKKTFVMAIPSSLSTEFDAYCRKLGLMKKRVIEGALRDFLDLPVVDQLALLVDICEANKNNGACESESFSAQISPAIAQKFSYDCYAKGFVRDVAVEAALRRFLSLSVTEQIVLVSKSFSPKFARELENKRMAI